MSALLLLLLILGVAAVVGMVWSFCVTAARADRRQRIAEAREYQRRMGQQ